MSAQWTSPPAWVWHSFEKSVSRVGWYEVGTWTYSSSARDLGSCLSSSGASSSSSSRGLCRRYSRQGGSSRARSGRSSRACGRSSAVRISSTSSRSSSTSFSRQSNLHSIHVKSKVLQTVCVANSVGRFVLCQLEAFSVRVCKVLGSALADLCGVVETVHKVGCEERVQLAACDCVAATAKSLERLACGV